MLLALLLLLSACGSGSVDVTDTAAADTPGGMESVAGELITALNEAGLSSVASAIAEIDDISVLFDDQDFTFLAPTDEAFLGITADDLADILSDQDALVGLLRNHVLAERLLSTELAALSEVQSGQGARFPVNADQGRLAVGGAAISIPDVAVADGVVHGIDAVLLPE